MIETVSREVLLSSVQNVGDQRAFLRSAIEGFANNAAVNMKPLADASLALLNVCRGFVVFVNP